jgi:hypothetical protein
MGLGAVPDVDAVLDEARDRLWRMLRTERDDKGIAVEGPVVEPHGMGDRVDRFDGRLDHPDPTIGQQAQRTDAILERMQPHDGPRLAQAHHEVRAAIDEDDLVGSREQVAQPGRGGDPAEATTEYDHAGHVGCLRFAGPDRLPRRA